MPLTVLSVQVQLHTECPKDTRACSLSLMLVSGSWGRFYKNPAFQQALSLNSNVMVLLNSEI